MNLSITHFRISAAAARRPLKFLHGTTILRGLLVIAMSLSTNRSMAADPASMPAWSPPAGKIVYLDFWASWCGPCAQSFPWLNEMQARYGDRLEIVAVNVDEKPAAAEQFLRLHPARFQIVYDPKGALAERYQIDGMPGTVILDAGGKLLHRHSGFRSTETVAYEAAILKAVDAVAANPRSSR